MTWLEDAAKYAEEHEFWAIETPNSIDTSFVSPKNIKEFYVLLETLTKDYASFGDVVVLVPLLGYFGMRNKEIYRVEPVKRNENNSHWQSGGTSVKANNYELSRLDWAIEHGTVDLWLYPHTQLSGIEPRVLIYGTGKPL